MDENAKKESAIDDPIRPLRSGRGTRRQIDRSDSELGHSDSLRAALGRRRHQEGFGIASDGEGLEKIRAVVLETGQKRLRLRTSNTSNRKMEKFGEFAYENGKNGCRSSAMRPPRWNVRWSASRTRRPCTFVGKVTEGHLKREAKIMMLPRRASITVDEGLDFRLRFAYRHRGFALHSHRGAGQIGVTQARITLEDCLENIPNRFGWCRRALVAPSSCSRGPPLVESDNKEVVTALREIAARKVKSSSLKRSNSVISESRGRHS